MPSLAMLHSPDPPLRFDEHQFAGRRVHAVSAESELSFSDLDRIHIFGLKGKRRREYIPAFAASDEKLRKVLATAAWQYCGGRRPIPDFLEGNLAELKRLVAARDEQWHGRPASDYPKSQLEMWQRHVFTTGWGGGYLQVRATIAYLSWRLGWPSNKIAEQLYMTPWNVRIILYRLTMWQGSLVSRLLKETRHSAWKRESPSVGGCSERQARVTGREGNDGWQRHNILPGDVRLSVQKPRQHHLARGGSVCCLTALCSRSGNGHQPSRF